MVNITCGSKVMLTLLSMKSAGRALAFSSFSSSQSLLVSSAGGCVILRLLHPVADDAEGLFQESRCPFAIGSFESNRVDLDFPV